MCLGGRGHGRMTTGKAPRISWTQQGQAVSNDEHEVAPLMEGPDATQATLKTDGYDPFNQSIKKKKK